MREDWVECKFDKVFFTTSGGTPSRRNEGYYIGNIPWIKSGELRSNVITTADEFISEDAVRNSSAKIFPAGTILLALYGATIGKIAILGIPAATNQAICGIFETPLVVSKYAYYFLVNKKSHLIKQGIGGAQPNISQTILKNLDFSLPPLPEQRAIVKKLESLFSSLDAGVADFKKAQQQLKIYRQAVLKKAFEGELTKEWKRQQRSLPSTTETIMLVSKERERYYQDHLNDWQEAVINWHEKGSHGKKPIKPGKPKQFEGVKISELEPYGLDAIYEWSRIGNMTYKVGDIDHKMPATVSNGIPYLSTSNIGKQGKLDFENSKLISIEDYNRLALKIKPEKGDIIFPRYGTIGRNILVNVDKKFLVSYSCAIIKTLPNVCSPKFLFYFSLSPIIQGEIKKYTVETTQKNIGIASIERFICPVFSLSEQHEIVKEIESRLSVCDFVEKSIKASLLKSEALRQSILKKAFEGKLLTAQELAECRKAPDYEPASLLLERIKAEQREAKPVKKVGNKKEKVSL